MAASLSTDCRMSRAAARSGSRSAAQHPWLPTTGVVALAHASLPLSRHKGSSSTRRPAAQRRSAATHALDPQQSSTAGAAAYIPHPWHERDYERVSLLSGPYGPMKLFEDNATFNGVLVFKREAEVQSSGDDLSVLEVFIAGDTAFNTWSLLKHQLMDRPMVHELMWTLVERARSGDAHNWGLLRAAIVELRENVFIGRLFFGDKDTGEVMWDCDCRPSDGIFLSLKAQSPFYIHRRVWDQAALPLCASSVFKIVASASQQHHAAASGSGAAAAAGSSAPSGTSPPPSASSAPPYPFTSGYLEAPSSSSSSSMPQYRMGSPGGSGLGGHDEDEQGAPAQWGGKPLNARATPDTLTMADVSFIRPDDPEAIKLLKRKLVVAVAEENYREAARIRDHAWMLTYREMHALRLQGRYEDAHQVELMLQAHIADADSSTQ